VSALCLQIQFLESKVVEGSTSSDVKQLLASKDAEIQRLQAALATPSSPVRSSRQLLSPAEESELASLRRVRALLTCVLTSANAPIGHRVLLLSCAVVWANAVT
jgi:hypothetical protein